MSIKLNSFIDIVSATPTKDAEGFVTHGDNIVASVRAYFEPKNSTEKWANMAVFSEADALFRFRMIPGLTVTPQMLIISDEGRYEIISVEIAKQRGMYLEVIAKKTEGSS
jgi:head-tail adaptor